MTNGWVRLWRDQFNHEISERRPWCDGYAWSFLYSRANYKPGIVNFRNQYIEVKRGQFITSALKLSGIFGWSRRRVDSFLKSLEQRKMCHIRRSNRFIVVTICNYEKHQSTELEIDTAAVTPNVTTDAQQVHTNKKEKKEKNKYTPSFLTFWAAFPRKVGKDSACKAWQKRTGDMPDVDTLLSALEKQKKSEQWQNEKFNPHPATWLNRGGWNDEIEETSGDGWG